MGTRKAAESQFMADAMLLAANWGSPTPFQVQKFRESAQVLRGLEHAAFMASVGCDNATVGVPEWPEQ